MSDGPAPNNWETAAPSLLWGVFAFAFGFEGVAMLFEGKWILAGTGIIGAITLTGIAIRWKQIAASFPRLSASAALAATDAKIWVATLLLVFAGIAGPDVYQKMVSLSVIRSDGKIAWNLNDAAAGNGFFLNMIRAPNQEIRVLGFQAHGKNISNGPVYELSGHIRSDLTNLQRPIFVLAQDEDESKVAACIPKIPTIPQETFGIPAFADFDVSTYDKSFAELEKDGIPISKFLNDFAPFTVTIEYDDVRLTRQFSRAEISRQVDVFEKASNLQSIPHVLRKKDARPAPLMPLHPIAPQATPVPPPELPNLKPLLSDPEYSPITGTVPSKN